MPCSDLLAVVLPPFQPVRVLLAALSLCYTSRRQRITYYRVASFAGIYGSFAYQSP